MKNTLLLLLISLGMTACSNIPKSIKQAPDKEVSLIEATGAGEHGTRIRWGGEVAKVENKDDQSLLEVVAYPLNHYGKPKVSSDSQGRFVATSDAFYDPQEYKKGTLITIIGKIAGAEKRTVDQRSLVMPVVEVQESHKWQLRPRTYRQDPFYDPFYSPYYPYMGLHDRYWRYPRFGYRYYYH